MYKTAGILIIIMISIYSCSSDQEKSVTVMKNGGEKVYQVHLKEIRDSLTLNLSDIATDFSFVKLETNEECLLSYGTTYVTSDYILIQKPNHGILQFDREGRFIRTLVKSGKGPREYISTSWTVDESDQILYMSEPGKMNYFLRFDLKTGAYLGDLKKAIPGKTGHIKFTGDKTLLVSRSGDIDISVNPYIIYYQDIDGNFISGISTTHERNIRTSQIMQGSEMYNYQYDSKDTVFTIDNVTLKPHVIIDFGEKIPDEMILGWNGIFEDFETRDFFIFMNSYISSVYKNEEGSSYSVFSDDHYILDKKEQIAYYCETIHINPTNHSIKDIEFLFLKVQDNGIVHFFYEAVGLLNKAKKALADPDFHEPYRSKLAEVVSTLKENDNPVLLVGKILR